MKNLILFLFFTLGVVAQAQLKVVTTTTTLKNLVESVGKDKVSVISITRKSQDPHFVEAKPSYMVKLRNADLLVAVGLDLEVGWLSLVQRGAKNPKLLNPKTGYFEAGEYVEAIEVPQGKVDRAQGDVHPQGNPHFHLDPLQVVKVLQALGKRLGELDSDNAPFYQTNASTVSKNIEQQLEKWQKRVSESGVKSVVTYHKSLNYFLKRFGLNPVAQIEPKPGIPPTAKHIISLIKKVKKDNVRCILNEDYFETTAAKRIKKDSKASLQVVPVEVQTNYFELIEGMVNSIEKCGQGS